ncbi:MAG: hypothetical protein R2689_01755 [Microthrixaceae bacterium]
MNDRIAGGAEAGSAGSAVSAGSRSAAGSAVSAGSAATASSIRAERDAVLCDVALSGFAIADLERLAAERDGWAVQTLRLLPCLEAMGAIGGKVRSRRAIAAAGLEEDVALGALSDAQWRALAQAVEANEAAQANEEEAQ